MPDDQIAPNKPGLDPAARLILGRQLRNYYDSMRQSTVSESLAQLLRQFENSASQDNEQISGEPAAAMPRSGN
jgi:hypothetical protein